MGAFRYCLAIIRRGLGHALELWGVTQLLQSFETWGLLNQIIETNRLAFALMMIAGTILFELFQMFERPDLSAACRDDSPMLPFPEDEK
jgi:hypothetical protein